MFTEQGHKVIGMKPIAAGRENGIWQDVELLRTASNIPAAVSDMNPYAFDSPISPHLAAQQAGITIDLSVIKNLIIGSAYKPTWSSWKERVVFSCR